MPKLLLAAAAAVSLYNTLCHAGEVEACHIATVFSGLTAIKDDMNCRSGCNAGSRGGGPSPSPLPLSKLSSENRLAGSPHHSALRLR